MSKKGKSGSGSAAASGGPEYVRQVPNFLARMGVKGGMSRTEEARSADAAIAPNLEDREDNSEEQPMIVDSNGVEQRKPDEDEKQEDVIAAFEQRDLKEESVAGVGKKRALKKRHVVVEEPDVVKRTALSMKKKKKKIGLSFQEEDL